VLKEYDGRVRLVFKDFPLPSHDLAMAAHEAARCAGAQGRFWAYHDALYHYTWNNFYAHNSSAEGQTAFTGHYEQLAQQAGVKDIAAFSACRAAGTYRNAVGRSRADGVSRGVQGTPTFFINGRRHDGGYDFETLFSAIAASSGAELGL